MEEGRGCTSPRTLARADNLANAGVATASSQTEPRHPTSQAGLSEPQPARREAPSSRGNALHEEQRIDSDPTASNLIPGIVGAEPGELDEQ